MTNLQFRPSCRVVYSGRRSSTFPDKECRMFKHLKMLWCAVCLMLFTAVWSQVSSAGQISGELKKWHKVTLTFNGPETSETAKPNPFLYYRLNVTLNGAFISRPDRSAPGSTVFHSGRGGTSQLVMKKLPAKVRVLWMVRPALLTSEAPTKPAGTFEERACCNMSASIICVLLKPESISSSVVRTLPRTSWLTETSTAILRPTAIKTTSSRIGPRILETSSKAIRPGRAEKEKASSGRSTTWHQKI